MIMNLLLTDTHILYYSYPALFPKFHGAMGGPHGHPGGLLGAAAAAAAMSAAGSIPMGRPHGLGGGGPPVPPLDDDDVKGMDSMMTSHNFKILVKVQKKAKVFFTISLVL